MCTAAAYGTGFARLVARRNELLADCQTEVEVARPVEQKELAKPLTNIAFSARPQASAVQVQARQAAPAPSTRIDAAPQPVKQEEQVVLQQPSPAELQALLRQGEQAGLQIGRKSEEKPATKSYNQLQAFKTAAQKFRAIGGVDVLTIRTITVMASCGYGHQAIGRGRLVFTNQSPDTNRGPLHVVLTLNPIADSLTEVGLTSAYQTTGPLAGEIVKRHLSKLRQRLEMSIAGSRAA